MAYYLSEQAESWIDTHSRVPYDVKDGARTLEDPVVMVRMADKKRPGAYSHHGKSRLVAVPRLD